MGCGGLCQIGSGGQGCGGGAGCTCNSVAPPSMQAALLTMQGNRQVLGGAFGRRSDGLAGGFPKGLGQLMPLNARNAAFRRIGPAHHMRRGLGQAAAVVDVNPADYVNVGWDSASATSMAQLDNNYNAGGMSQATYIASAQAIVGALAPTGTVDENAADYAGLGWSNSAAQMAANAGSAFNAGSTTLAQFQAAMQQAVAQMFAAQTSTVAPAATITAAGTPSGLTPSQQSAVDIAAIQGATSVLNTGIAGAVAGAKGTTLSTTANQTPSALSPTATSTAMTTNQKIGLGIGAVVIVGGIIWYASSSKGGRRRRR
jgi:hypothetical protein